MPALERAIVDFGVSGLADVQARANRLGVTLSGVKVAGEQAERTAKKAEAAVESLNASARELEKNVRTILSKSSEVAAVLSFAVTAAEAAGAPESVTGPLGAASRVLSSTVGGASTFSTIGFTVAGPKGGAVGAAAGAVGGLVVGVINEAMRDAKDEIVKEVKAVVNDGRAVSAEERAALELRTHVFASPGF